MLVSDSNVLWHSIRQRVLICHRWSQGFKFNQFALQIWTKHNQINCNGGFVRNPQSCKASDFSDRYFPLHWHLVTLPFILAVNKTLLIFYEFPLLKIHPWKKQRYWQITHSTSIFPSCLRQRELTLLCIFIYYFYFLSAFFLIKGSKAL